MKKDRGEINLALVLAAGVALFIFFMVPLYLTANKTDKTIQLSAQSSIEELKNKVVITGVFTEQDLQNLDLAIGTSMPWKVEYTIQVLDENPAKKHASDTIDGKVYVTYYDTQVRDMIAKDKKVVLKAGDQFSISAEMQGSYSDNMGKSVMGNKNSNITVKTTGMVSADGN